MPQRVQATALFHLAPQPFQVGDGDAAVFNLQQARSLQPLQRRVAALARYAREVGNFFLRHLQVRVAARVQPGVGQGWNRPASARATWLSVSSKWWAVKLPRNQCMRSLIWRSRKWSKLRCVACSHSKVSIGTRDVLHNPRESVVVRIGTGRKASFCSQ